MQKKIIHQQIRIASRRLGPRKVPILPVWETSSTIFGPPGTRTSPKMEQDE